MFCIADLRNCEFSAIVLKTGGILCLCKIESHCSLLHNCRDLTKASKTFGNLKKTTEILSKKSGAIHRVCFRFDYEIIFRYYQPKVYAVWIYQFTFQFPGRLDHKCLTFLRSLLIC